MFLLKHEDKRHFVNGAICNDVLVPCLHNQLRVFAPDHLECVFQVHNWHCLHAEDVVTFENCDEVFLDEEPLLKGVDVFIEGVFFAVVNLLNLLKGLEYVSLGISGALLQDVGHHFIKKLVDTVCFKVVIDDSQRFVVFVAEAEIPGQLVDFTFAVVTSFCHYLN